LLAAEIKDGRKADKKKKIENEYLRKFDIR
jgi:hypothetical protein